MSNIGKQSILIPKDVDIKVYGWKLYVKGPKGEFTFIFPNHTKLIKKKENNLYLSITAPLITKALYGSLQRKLKNIIFGVSLDYVTHIQFVGVGYRPRLEANILILRLGFSHEIQLKKPSTLKCSIVKRNNLKISGTSLEEVRQFAYKIRSYRPPEPFKGKGIVCYGEEVRRKEGKKKKA